MVLVGRSEIIAAGSEPDEWANSKTERLFYLQSAGSEVQYLPGDLSNKDDLKKIVESTELSFGKINGVIHLAGDTNVNNFQFIKDIKFDTSAKVLSSKIKGIENLHEIFSKKRPDFVWIASTISTILGGLGYGSYSSANLYMEHFIKSKSRHLPNWKILSLSQTVFSKSDIKMEEDDRRKALTPEEIIKLFEFTLTNQGKPNLFQSIEDLTSSMEVVYAKLLEDKQELSQNSYKNARPELSNEKIEANTKTEKKLVAIFEDFFSYSGLGIEDDFFELGGDSLKAMMLLKRINKEFQVELNLQHFFSVNTIEKLASLIDQIESEKSKTEFKNDIII